MVGGHLQGKCQIFDPLGNFVSVFGAGILFSPNHLFVDSDDNILVASGKLIEVFNSDGTHLKSIGEGVFSFASDVWIDRNGRIVVSDFQKHTIFVF